MPRTTALATGEKEKGKGKGKGKEKDKGKKKTTKIAKQADTLLKAAKKTVEKTREKRKRRVRFGTRALQEMKFQQKKVDNIFRKAPFWRIVREEAHDLAMDDTAFWGDTPKGVMFSRGALYDIQVLTESYLLELAANSQLDAIHCNNIRVSPKHVRYMLGLKYSQFIGDRLIGYKKVMDMQREKAKA